MSTAAAKRQPVPRPPPDPFILRIRQHEADMIAGAAALREAAISCGGVAKYMRLVGAARRQFYEWQKTGIPVEQIPASLRVAPSIPAKRLRPDVARQFIQEEAWDA